MTDQEKYIDSLEAEMARLKRENDHWTSALQRVRELARKFEQEPKDAALSYDLAAYRIWGALDGNQK
jgi:hypothetical protein